MTTDNTIDVRLSYSSANLLRGCERRYFFYKVEETEKDKDYDDNTEAFAIGKSFHHILEMSMHKKPEKIANLLEECVQKFDLEEEKAPLVHAMVINYLRLHKTTNLETIHCEYQIQDDIVNGFIDVIFKEKDSENWWICDLKTSTRLASTLISRLPQDRQLNLYSYFYKQIAKEFKLNPDKFMGCKYRVTTKSLAKMRSHESYADYVLRMANLIKTYDIEVPISKMNPVEVYEEHKDLFNRSLQLRNHLDIPRANYSYCDSYFRSCPYWSRCHGKCFSEMSDDLKVTTL